MLRQCGLRQDVSNYGVMFEPSPSYLATKLGIALWTLCEWRMPLTVIIPRIQSLSTSQAQPIGDGQESLATSSCHVLWWT